MSFTVFENGVFHPIDAAAPSSRQSNAIVVEAVSIAFAGTVGDCRDFTGGRHESIDLAGAHVLPGFTDGHIHTAQLALQSAEIDLSGARSLEETLAIVRARVDSRANPAPAPGEWLFGGRWNNRAWKNQGMPTRHELDSVTGAVPVALHHADLHTYWVNSAGLARMGITAETPDPIGGSISRGADGVPTGVLGEAAAFAAERFFAAHTAIELDATMQQTLRELLSFGVTSIHDIDGEDALRSFVALHSTGELPLRVHKLMPVSALDELIDKGIRSGSGDSRLSYGAVKIFGDGSLSSRTCLLHEPYPGQPDNLGIAVTPPNLLNELVQRCSDNGLAAAIHAIGDGAVSNAIDALRKVRATASTGSRLPNRVEHVQHIATADIPRFGALGAVACMQPASCTSDIDMVDELLAGRQLASYAWRSILDAGGTIAFSSDAPVESINPFTGIHAAVTRRRPDGYPLAGWQPWERLTRAEAIACYTLGPARASGESATKGALVTGHLADLAVLDRDPFAVDDSALLSTAVQMTVVGGAVAWSR